MGFEVFGEGDLEGEERVDGDTGEFGATVKEF